MTPESEDLRPEAIPPTEIAARSLHAETGGIAAGKIEGGVYQRFYGPGGSDEEQSPILWQGLLAGASGTTLGVHPLPGD